MPRHIRKALERLEVMVFIDEQGVITGGLPKEGQEELDHPFDAFPTVNGWRDRGWELNLGGDKQFVEGYNQLLYKLLEYYSLLEDR